MTIEQIARQRFHGLCLSRKCGDIVELSRELLGLHCCLELMTEEVTAQWK